mgnify:CR=1 FL=1
MSFRSIFITDEDDGKSNKKAPAPVQPVLNQSFPTGNSFPTSQPVYSPQPSIQNNPAPQTNYQVSSQGPNNEQINKAFEIYKSGFDNLNQDGYDFYEFYQCMVQTGDISNPSAYNMAFNMAKVMKGDLNKDDLVNQANFYIGKINEAYNVNVEKGKQKKEQLASQKASDIANLQNEISLLTQQLEAVKKQLDDKKMLLDNAGSNIDSKISEVESMLSANDIGKNQLISSIETVKQGIINNVK